MQHAPPKQKKRVVDIYGLTTPFNTHGPSLTSDMYTFYGVIDSIPSLTDTCGKKPFPIGFGQKHRDKVKSYNDCKLNFDYNKANSIKALPFVTYQGKAYTTQQAYDYALSKGFQGTYVLFVVQYGTPEIKGNLQSRLDNGQNLESALMEIVKANKTGFDQIKETLTAKPDPALAGPSASPTPSTDNIGNESNWEYWLLGGIVVAGIVGTIIYKSTHRVKA